jgi:hypothetical protein
MNRENREIINGQVAANAGWPNKEFRNTKKKSLIPYFSFF